MKAEGAEALLLPGTAVVLAFLLVESTGMGAAGVASLGMIAAVPVLALSLCVVARRRGFHCLHMSVCAVVLGSIGVLVGARLDFGQFGLATIADWCRVLEPLSLDAIRSQVALAPWTCVGMLGGCNLGMALSMRLLGHPSETRPAFIARFVACNAGMIIGMSLTEVLLPISDSVIEGVSATACMFSIMVLGMTVGMWGGWWSSEWALRAWRRRAHLAASRHSPSLRI